MCIRVYVCKARFRMFYEVKMAEPGRTHKHPYAHTFFLFPPPPPEKWPENPGVYFGARGVAKNGPFRVPGLKSMHF